MALSIARKSELQSIGIPWAAPVPFFGDYLSARVATLGLNPSASEYIDRAGLPLSGRERRLEDIHSLGLKSWSDAEDAHFSRIVMSCLRYFSKNPYDRWFKPLDQMLASLGVSYYLPAMPLACHLDLMPVATAAKWGAVPIAERRTSQELFADWFVELLRCSAIELLILNGAGVVDGFERLAGPMPRLNQSAWRLGHGNRGVDGWSVDMKITSLRGRPLRRSVHVVGFNLNIQSSYGVTRAAKSAIQTWLGGWR